MKSFFGNAILKGGTLWFNGSSKNGIFCYDWVKQKFLMEMQRALGDINLALAVDRVIVKQFSLVPPKRTVTPQTKQTVAQVCGKLVAGL